MAGRPGWMIVATGGAALMLSGCVERIAEDRVRSALIGSGLSARDADCMARRMVDRLSIAQLRRLEALSGQSRASLSRMSPVGYVALVRRIGDGEVIAVTASSAALCATGLAR